MSLSGGADDVVLVGVRFAERACCCRDRGMYILDRGDWYRFSPWLRFGSGFTALPLLIQDLANLGGKQIARPVDHNVLILRVCGLMEPDFPDGLARLLFGPVAPWRGRDAMLFTDLLQRNIRNPELFGHLPHGPRPDQVIHRAAG